MTKSTSKEGWDFFSASKVLLCDAVKRCSLSPTPGRGVRAQQTPTWASPVSSLLSLLRWSTTGHVDGASHKERDRGQGKGGGMY